MCANIYVDIIIIVILSIICVLLCIIISFSIIPKIYELLIYKYDIFHRNRIDIEEEPVDDETKIEDDGIYHQV